MKRFIVSILCVSVFFIGLGALADKAGARLKSDEKALEIIRQARLAIGGDQAITSVRSMTITGKTSVTFKAGESEQTEQGDTEIAVQLPNGFMRMTKIGRTDGVAGEQAATIQHDVMILRKGDAGAPEAATGEITSADGQKVIVRKLEGGEARDGEFTTPDGKKVIIRHTGSGDEQKIIVRKGEAVPGDAPDGALIEKKIRTAHEGMRQNELLCTTLGLLLTAPDGMDVSYTFAGESDVDGTACNVVNTEFAGSSVKLYISKASSLPVMMSYQGHAMPQVFNIRTKAPEGEEAKKDNVIFVRSAGGPEGASTEFQVRFSDFRGVNGVQLPFRWTTSTGGRTTEVFDVTNYDINPANIAEKFKNQKVFVRTKKDSQ